MSPRARFIGSTIVPSCKFTRSNFVPCKIFSTVAKKGEKIEKLQYIYQQKNLLQKQSLSQKQLLKAQRIDQALQEYFEAHPEQRTATPCELMPLLLEKGIFYKPDPEGRQLSYFLCKMEKMDSIHLLRHRTVKTADKNWYFEKKGKK
jgi:hypothetical protein